MKTLFIDSSRKSLSVALISESKLLFVSNVNSHSKHSNFLVNELNNILNKAKLSIYDIDNFVVLNGPGSFTGVRVGVTVAKVISYTLSKKIYLVNNLRALKAGINDDVVISVIPDKNKSSYVGYYSKDKIVEDYLNIDNDLFDLKDNNITVVFLEDSEFKNDIVNKLSINNKVNVINIKDYDYVKIVNDALKEKDVDAHLAMPIYLKKIDAEK